MATNLQSVFDYLTEKGSLEIINRDRLVEICSAYNQLKADHTFANDDDLVQMLIKEFSIVNDTENFDRLKQCVTNVSVDLAYQIVQKEYTLKLITQKRLKVRNAKSSSNVHVETNPTTQTNVEIMKQIICQILIKQNHTEVISLIENFFLCQLSKLTQGYKRRTTSPLSADKLYNGLVCPGTILYEFIRFQLSSRGGVIDVGRTLTRFPLVEPLLLVDQFDTWNFDYLRGLFELNLLPPSGPFPKAWQIDDNTQFFYLLELPHGNNGTNCQRARNNDRPSTVSLQRFVEDVCDKENNGMGKKWLNALTQDDIFTYDHLVNLKFDEWNQLKTLSMNGRKILKSYVDREKQMANDMKNQTKPDETNSNQQSESELYAKIHQVQLYFHYTLADKFHVAQIPRPAKLNADCVHLSFEEMRRDGFEDDGLFDQMKMFFLPLTMVENDLAIDETHLRSLNRGRETQRNNLQERREQLIGKLAEKESRYYDHDDSLNKLRKETNDKQSVSDDVAQRDYESFSISELLVMHTNGMKCLENEKHSLRTQIQEIDDLLNSLDRVSTDYNVNQSGRSDKDLIKPNRGFIMYGPPGTGKSDIMSKLSARTGICMVAPPLAAGELNRSLVGESERIIIDICMRCHRVPYLMCCVSIDEIDSLAPKRTDDSKDGNLAKLSVLLSVIDGIKDVPNLMIFCATNRLHMMDEAFLRRMSGKFFVGRPSSQARKNILSGIKPWHMPTTLLDSLTMVTTNFSGAALRALRRLITVYCVDMKRRNPAYLLDYSTMLRLTDVTARQYRIFLGAETLPNVIARSVVDNDTPINNQQFNDLTYRNNSIYTGRILTNLNTANIDIEAVETNPITGESKKIVYRYALLDSETILQGLLERLTTYGKLRNVQLLQLVDLNLLSAESAHDEKQKFETLKERLDECGAYRRSMIVYDLDSLVGINRSEGNASTGRTTNFSLINHNIYTHIKDKFQNTYVQHSTNNSTQDTEEKWSVVFISDAFLLRQFSDDVKFTRPQSEIDEEQAEECRANQQILCVQCDDYYIEQDNRMGACAHHNGFIYDVYSVDLAICIRKRVIENLLDEESRFNGRLNRNPPTQEEKENFERQKHRFRYICCDQVLQIGGAMSGCKRGKHSERNVTREHWETTCDRNQEYRRKRLALLEKRAH
ncbi:unnamed protein product [Adineta ricciae]|uniref:AAA+ ATPase domain-containing protein n=1 Tax=Adineta ricciae TaxID=249248 RepID=A0A815R7Q2_ADIRI|nr:unnamed protein product [Adineta ricciae]